MATLTTKDRKKLPKGDFGLPGGKFPMPDLAHARLAKSGASRALHAGTISKAQEEKIDAKASKLLGHPGAVAGKPRMDAAKAHADAHKQASSRG